MPRIVVVNEHDVPIGLKERTAIGPNDYYRVSAIWITNSTGEVLLAQRSATKKHDPLRWGAGVVGTVDEDEEYLDNAVKEAQEEIGLVILPTALVPGPKNLIRRPDRNYFCQWYSYTTDAPIESFTRQVEEVDALQWVPLATLKTWLRDKPDDFVSSTTEWIDELLDEHSKYLLNQPICK